MHFNFIEDTKSVIESLKKNETFQSRPWQIIKEYLRMLHTNYFEYALINFD